MNKTMQPRRHTSTRTRLVLLQQKASNAAQKAREAYEAYEVVLKYRQDDSVDPPSWEGLTIAQVMEEMGKARSRCHLHQHLARHAYADLAAARGF